MGGVEIPKMERENMSGKPNNPYAAGPVIEWKMTKEELEAYLAKHPIVYREELKNLHRHTRWTNGHKKNTEARCSSAN
ncbi:hypothetical protein BsIDN1_10650 [Bacillus safensis]|uniref:Uncharacterized protein n=1 Tax=Bacillus safensis TaxID=561879 RepID=A0A5S9M1H0_BACIA|nr:hypothetical protein BsIDN1_10650 [Bacillus safensis]